MKRNYYILVRASVVTETKKDKTLKRYFSFSYIATAAKIPIDAKEEISVLRKKASNHIFLYRKIV